MNSINIPRKLVNTLIGVLFVLAFIAGIYLLGQTRIVVDEEPQLSDINVSDTEKDTEGSDVISNCVPAFRDGGGPYYKPGSPFRFNIAPEETDGQRLGIEGYLYNSDCSSTISDAVIDIWQANESGNYEDEYYRGQIVTDGDGSYRFETVVPKGYGEGTGYRPPHIHFKVFIDGIEVVTSQMFFDDVRGRAGFNDAYIIEISEEEEILLGNYNIVLPGIE